VDKKQARSDDDANVSEHVYQARYSSRLTRVPTFQQCV
jgi:hypothetical protein